MKYLKNESIILYILIILIILMVMFKDEVSYISSLFML